MNREAVYDKARQLMEKHQGHPDREAGYVLHHGSRVALLALRLAGAAGTAVDADVLWAAALFHDAGKGLEPHWYTGRGIVMEHLSSLADSPEQLAAIAHLVRYHAKRSDPAVYSPELRFLQDADILDHRGSLQVWVAVAQAAKAGCGPEAILADWNLPERIKRREEFREMLHYEVSRREYDRRIQEETAFYKMLAEDMG